MMTAPVLTVKGLSIMDRDGAALVRDVEIELARGRAFVLIGETGSGKSLVAQALLGLLPKGLDARGRIAIEGQVIDATDRAALQRAWGDEIAFVPQEPRSALDPTMRLLPQIAGRASRSRAREAMAGVDLERRAERRFPFMLSGGMAQRAIVAGALADPSPVIIADEPTKGLDDARVDETIARLRRLLSDGRALVVVTHDLRVAGGLRGEIGVMRTGVVVEQGSAEGVLSDPRHPYTRAWLAADPERWPARKPAKRTDPVLEAEGISYRIGGRTLFRDVGVRLDRQGVVAIMGPSGSGKTMLGNVLLGLSRPHEGRVLWDGGVDSLAGRKRRSLRARYQKLHQDPVSTFVPRRLFRQQFDDLRSVLPQNGVDERLGAFLERLKLDARLLDRRPEEVSGGEAQRLALARVLLFQPLCLVADEPTSRLDPVIQGEIMAFIRELVDETGMGLILTSHDRRVASKLADEVIELG